MNIETDHIFYGINIVIYFVLLCIMYRISATLWLIYGVLDSRIINNQRDKGYINSTKKIESDQTPEPIYVDKITKIDDSVYVTKVSTDGLVENPNKNIGNVISVKNDIDEDINKLKELKKR